MCDCSYDFVGQWPIFVWSSSFSFVIIHILILTVVIIIIIITVADPGDGPGGPGSPLIFDQKEARRVEKIFGDRPPPSYLNIWIRRCIILINCINILSPSSLASSS